MLSLTNSKLSNSIFIETQENIIFLIEKTIIIYKNFLQNNVKFEKIQKE